MIHGAFLVNIIAVGLDLGPMRPPSLSFGDSLLVFLLGLASRISTRLEGH